MNNDVDNLKSHGKRFFFLLFFEETKVKNVMTFFLTFIDQKENV